MLSWIGFTNRTADVYPYDSDYAPALNVPIVSSATAYDHSDGQTYILIFHESLYYGRKFSHSLINPNQVRHNGVDFWDNPYDRDHDLSIKPNEGPIIPLRYNRTKLNFHTRVPTNEELSTCQHIEMTSPAPWEPASVQLGELQTARGNQQRHIFSVTTNKCHLVTICIAIPLSPMYDIRIPHQMKQYFTRPQFSWFQWKNNKCGKIKTNEQWTWQPPWVHTSTDDFHRLPEASTIRCLESCRALEHWSEEGNRYYKGHYPAHGAVCYTANSKKI